MFGGVIGIAAGLLVLKNPIESTAVVPAVVALLMGVFGLIIGISGLIDAFKGGGWGIGVFGVVTLIIGLLFIFNSVVSGQVLVWLLALLLVIQGVVTVVFTCTLNPTVRALCKMSIVRCQEPETLRKSSWMAGVGASRLRAMRRMPASRARVRRSTVGSAVAVGVSEHLRPFSLA